MIHFSSGQNKAAGYQPVSNTVTFTQSALTGPVLPQAAKVGEQGLHFLAIAFFYNRQTCTFLSHQIKATPLVKERRERKKIAWWDLKFEPTISWSEGIGSTTVLRPLPNYGGIAPPRIPFILQFCWSQDICYLTSNRWFPKWRFFAKLFQSKDQVTLVFCSWHSSCTSSTGWSWFRDHTGRAWARGRGPARCLGLLGIAALPDGPTETSSCGWKHQRWCRYHQPVAVAMSTFKAFGHFIYLTTNSHNIFIFGFC